MAQTEAGISDKNQWNSLEIVKLVIAAATPLMIFGMGTYLSHQSEKQASQLRAQERLLADKKEISDWNRQVNLSSMTYLVQKRVTIWDGVSKDIYALDDAMGDLHLSGSVGRIDQSEVRQIQIKIDQINSSLKPNLIYFSRDFDYCLRQYLRRSSNFLVPLRHNINKSDDDLKVLDKSYERYSNGYEIFMIQLAKELGILSDPRYAPKADSIVEAIESQKYYNSENK